MGIPQKIIKYLNSAKIKYESIKHRIVYTAYDKAQTLKVPQKNVGKTLVVKLGKEPALVLIPANKNLDKIKFKRVVNNWRKKRGEKPVKSINFATEDWMKKRLIGVKIGAIPPFGNLWGLPTFLDKILLNLPKIIISGGDYNWSIKIRGANFKKLIPDLIIGNFSKSKK